MVGDMKVVVIPSRYSQDELEKMFPVPEQWKEWYRLEKEGKLPKYVKIIDLYQAAIDQCREERKRYVIKEPCKIDMNDIADSMINFKEEIKGIDVKKYEIKMKQDGIYGCSRLDMDVDQGHQHYIKLLPLLIDCLKKADPGEPFYTGTAILNLIKYYKTHPLFWEKEIEEMRKYISDFWFILQNAEKLTSNVNDQEILIYIAVDAIYMLSNDASYNSILSYISNNNISASPLHYNYHFYDPVYYKSIFYTDYELKPFFEEMFRRTNYSDQYVSIRYFIEIGDIDKKLEDKMITFVKNNLNFMGLEIFYILLKSKTDDRVKELAHYLYINRKKIDYKGFGKDTFDKILFDSFGYKTDKDK